MDRVVGEAAARDVVVRPARVLPALMLVMLLGAIDHSIMAPVLPAVAADLGGLELMPSVLTAYLAAATVVMPLYGKLGDRFGRKPVLLASVGVFVLGAALCAVAPSMPALIVFRVVQGLGGGGLSIGAQAVLGEIASPRERGRYLGLLGAVYVLAAVGGPLLGGFAVDQLTWRWIFVFYLPLGLVAVVALARTVALAVPRHRLALDWLGALLLSAAVVGVVLCASTVGQPGQWPGWLAPTAAVVAVVAALAWLFTARRAADPVLPPRLLRARAIVIPMGISFLIGFALLGTISFMPAYLQVTAGLSATQSGLVVAVFLGAVIIMVVASGQIIARTGRYKLFPVVGTAMAAVGLAVLGTIDPTTPPPLVLAYLVLVGLGIGMVLQVMVLIAQNEAEYRDLGAATSAVSFLQQIGSTTGVAVVGALVTARFAAGLPAGIDPGQVGTDVLDPQRLAELPAGLRDAAVAAYGQAVPPVFGFVAPLLALACVLAIALPARPLRDTVHVENNPDGGVPLS